MAVNYTGTYSDAKVAKDSDWIIGSTPSSIITKVYRNGNVETFHILKVDNGWYVNRFLKDNNSTIIEQTNLILPEEIYKVFAADLAVKNLSE